MICRGDTNKDNRYHMTLVGNRPEFMPLDTNLFADLKTKVRQHVCMAPEVFNIGNVKNLQSAVKRVWQQMEPERIRKDIMRWPEAVDKVISQRTAATFRT